MAGAFTELSRPGAGRRCLADLERWTGLVAGRGACHHPDGTVRLARSALAVFSGEIGQHLAGQCTAGDRGPAGGPTPAAAPFLPLPADDPRPSPGRSRPGRR